MYILEILNELDEFSVVYFHFIFVSKSVMMCLHILTINNFFISTNKNVPLTTGHSILKKPKQF